MKKHKKYKKRKKTWKKAGKKKLSLKVSSKLKGFKDSLFNAGANLSTTLQFKDNQYLKLGIDCHAPAPCSEEDKERVVGQAIGLLETMRKRLSKYEQDLNLNPPDELGEAGQEASGGESDEGQEEEKKDKPKEKKGKKSEKEDSEFLDL